MRGGVYGYEAAEFGDQIKVLVRKLALTGKEHKVSEIRHEVYKEEKPSRGRYEWKLRSEVDGFVLLFRPKGGGSGSWTIFVDASTERMFVNKNAYATRSSQEVIVR